MSEPTTTTWKHLAPNPKSKYKELFIKGRRIRATVLYGWHVCAEPRSAEEIAADYALPLEAVQEAIAYCQGNPPEIKEDFERGERLMKAIGLDKPGGKYRVLTPQERAQLDHEDLR